MTNLPWTCEQFAVEDGEVRGVLDDVENKMRYLGTSHDEGMSKYAGDVEE